VDEKKRQLIWEHLDKGKSLVGVDTLLNARGFQEQANWTQAASQPAGSKTGSQQEANDLKKLQTRAEDSHQQY